MIICFDCEHNVKTIMDELIKSRQYKDYNEIINMAIENLSILEAAVNETGGVIFDNGQIKTNKSHSKPSNETEKDSIFNKFYLLNKIPNGTIIPNAPKDEQSQEKIIQIKNWLWGQYNRFLPVKISCRSIANHLEGSRKGLSISELPLVVAREALEFAKYLALFEKQHNLNRDDLLSTAFPSPEKDEEKSLLRFANQFVATKNSSDELQGFLFDLKLVNYSSKNNNEDIALTNDGWNFALLRNPILEDFQEDPKQKFSEEERDFLLQHIINNVPEERYAYEVLIGELTRGNNTPDQLDQALMKIASNESGNNISESFLSTQRSGAISRMIELELVKRLRKGIRVKYIATEMGKEYFS